MNIAILPGLYEEEPSLPAPTGECAALKAPQSSLGYQILSYEQQVQCRHNQNLVAILGKTNLQIEGTGASRLDVVVDAKYQKLNAIRADRSNGVYFRNFTAQRTTFNSLYVLAGDGFVIDDVLTRWNDEYGFLTFASDHGLYKNCESYGNGDSGIYPGSASNINDGRGYEVPGTPSRSPAVAATTTWSATPAPRATRCGCTTTSSTRTWAAPRWTAPSPATPDSRRTTPSSSGT